MARASKRIDGVSLLGGLLVLMYSAQLFNMLSNGALLRFGIFPRELSGLPGILAAPFIHGSWWHLFNNTVGLVIFSALCLTRGVRFYLKASGFIVLVGGLLVWMFGRSAVHVGASGWIFGLWSLCIALAWFERSVINILIAVGVVIFYGGMIAGVLPGNPYVSFEGHAFGALAGVFAAATFGRRRRQFSWR